MRRILVLAKETDVFVSALRQPLTRAGFDFFVESSLSSFVYAVDCDSQRTMCQLSHRGIDVNPRSHALVVNRLSPYQDASLSPFMQSEVAAGIWAALSSLSVPVLNRPSDVGIFPGSDPSYLAPRLRKLGWGFSSLFGAVADFSRLDCSALLNQQEYQVLENCFAFFLVGDSLIPIWGDKSNPELNHRLPQLLRTLADAGITFAFIAVAVENGRPLLVDLNTWPAADIMQAFATSVVDAIAVNYL